MQQIWNESIAREEREVEQATTHRKKAEAQNSTTKVRLGKRTFDCTEEKAERNLNKRHQQPLLSPPPSSLILSLSVESEADNKGSNSTCKTCKGINYKHK